METLATKLPPELVHGVDALVRRGTYPNRSDALRAAVRRLLQDEASAPRTADPRDQDRFDRYQRTMRRIGRDPRYRDRYVAVHQGKVLDVDDEFDPLVRRVFARSEHPIQVGLASPEGKPIVTRVPGVRVKAR